MRAHETRLQRVLGILVFATGPAHVGKLVTCVGMLTTAKPVHTIKDEPMEFVTFDDGTGLIETVIFPDVYRKVVALLFGSGPYVMRGKVEESYGAVTLTVTALERLDRYAQRRGLPCKIETTA